MRLYLHQSSNRQTVQETWNSTRLQKMSESDACGYENTRKIQQNPLNFGLNP